MRVLGIDPSIRSTGFGIIEFSQNAYTVLSYGVIKPSRNLLFHHKINKIKNQVDKLITDFSADEVAIETDASDALAAAYCHLNSRIFQERIKQTGAKDQ